MTTHETVTRDSQSYRQGLVLGLTLAEVMLLLVFVLLMAMAAIWKFERGERLKLVALSASNMSDTTKQLFSHLVGVLKDTKSEDANRVADAIRQINNGKVLEPLDKAEKQFITEERQQFENQPARAIDDNWRALTNALRHSRDLQKRLEIADSVMRAPAPLKKGGHDWPPIIRLREAAGYYFAKGSAELPEQFQLKIHTDVVPELLRIAKDFDVDVIEVIGHTDEQAILQRFSNLDTQLFEVTKGKSSIGTLQPADNAGLGLARAVSVAHALSLESALKHFKILPLSGGQLIDTDDTVAQGVGGDVKERRRIEIRLRRSQN
jgi:outer membrane protein OmpA-like peptidoglycan-associated protein